MAGPDDAVEVEVRVQLKPGILDPEAETVQKSLGLLGIPSVAAVSTAHVYRLRFAGVDRSRAEALARQAVDRLLANPVIHQVTLTPVPR